MKIQAIAIGAILAVLSPAHADVDQAALEIERVPRLSLVEKSSGYVTAGWAVKVRNKSRNEMKGLWVNVKFLDKKGVQVHSGMEKLESLPAFKTVNVTDTIMLKEDVWNRIDSVEVSVD